MICNKCKADLSESDFRKRDWGLSGNCLQCERDYSKQYHQKKKADEDWRRKMAERSRAYHKKNKALVLEKQKERRNTLRSKQIRKEYDKQNRDRIYEMSIPVKQRWRENNKQKLKVRAKNQSKEARKNLYDYYVRGQLKNKGYSDDEITPELINQYRISILKIRINKLIQSIDNYEKQAR